MDKGLSMLIYGCDVNDEAETFRSLGLDNMPVKQSCSSGIGIDINPNSLFNDKDSVTGKTVVVRGPNLGDVKKVTMLPGGNIVIENGGI